MSGSEFGDFVAVTDFPVTSEPAAKTATGYNRVRRSGQTVGGNYDYVKSQKVYAVIPKKCSVQSCAVKSVRVFLPKGVLYCAGTLGVL